MPLENKINISSELSLKTIKVGDASKKYYTKEEADAKFINKEFLVNYYTKEETDQKEEYIYDYIDNGLSLKVNNSEVSIFAQDNTIVKRTTGGKVDIRVSDPQYNDEPASKNYVDNGLSTKADKTSLADYVPWSNVSQNASGLTVVQRKDDSSVDIRVPLTPAYDNEPSSKQYVDNHHDSTKADKSELTNYVPWTSVSYDAYGNSIVQRKEDSSVDIRVPLAPTYNNEPASKNYVDTGLAGKVNSSEVTVHAVANTIVKRKGDSKVDIRVPEPTYGDEPASKNYADTKLAKVTSSASHNRLYVINADGSQSTTELTSSSTPGYAVPYRRQDGNIMVPLTPGQNSDAASKGYVDDQIIASKVPTTSASAGDVLTLDSNKNPTWAAAADGGTKLYIHKIQYKRDDTGNTIYYANILSNLPGPFTYNTTFSQAGGKISNFYMVIPGGIINQTSRLIYYWQDSRYVSTIYQDLATGEITVFNSDANSKISTSGYIDTVTEL